jgi:single stranded DNA-binding protein
MAAGDVNKVILVGRVTRGPIIKPTKAGVPQAVFGLSTTEIWFDKATDSKRERTTQHRIVVYGGPLVTTVEKCVHVNARVYIEGTLEIRRWVGKDGTPTQNWTCEVVVMGWSGRITVLNFADELTRAEADGFDAPDAAPAPLSRSAARYGDADDTETSGLSRFLQEPDDQARARRRAAGDSDTQRRS